LAMLSFFAPKSSIAAESYLVFIISFELEYYIPQ
jgi:hypothetical protein